ncbi:MAG: DUF87 domain-containing protein [Thermoproteales archaeon]|nr:DUF87 domain-containing protein [Thermoproteales archaeon]
MKIKLKDFLEKKTLILGEVGSGKTALTAKILEELVNHGYGDEITVIDMAPDKIGEIGGKLRDYTEKTREVRYLTPPKIYAPRTIARSPSELLRMAKHNADVLRKILEDFLKNPTPILIVNDLSIYFHAGDLELIIECLEISKTFLANSYYGRKIYEDYGTGVTERERNLVNRLILRVDKVVLL